MKKKISKEERNFLLTQIFVFVLFVAILFTVTLQVWQDWHTAMGISFVVATTVIKLWMMFAINNYWLVPRFYIGDSKHPKARKGLFWLFNLLIIFGLNFHLVFNLPILSNQLWQQAVNFGYSIFSVFMIILHFLMIGLAIGRNSYVKQRQLRQQLAEEKERSTEAELSWLKNQLNPHFLFNTLNNISSLVQIDSDMAQDKIGQLSDLLRYALYETKTETVDIGGEIEFMQNYIDLMSLRCGANVDIQTHFDIHNSNRKIAPMLFLSPIENAFKHGVSSSKPSFIHISMSDDSNGILFLCENSNYPKDDTNRSGSGIGIENLKRRLQLIYPERHTFEHRVEGDTYIVKITINDI